MEGRKLFSRLGWALLAQMGVMLAVQFVLVLLARWASPGLLASPVFLWAVSVLSAYGLGVPAFCLALRGTPAPPPAPRRPVGAWALLRCGVSGLGLMYAVNFATLLLTWLIGLLRGAAVENPVESMAAYPAALNLLLSCVIAPVCEELVFRRLLLERLRPYGDSFAALASALCFGLFHGNLNQFFYAFAIGTVLAALMLKTGCLWQNVLLHALLNFVSAGMVPLLSGLGEGGAQLLSLLVLGALALGLAMLPSVLRELRPGPSRPGVWRAFLTSPGVLCFCALALALAMTYLL